MANPADPAIPQWVVTIGPPIFSAVLGFFGGLGGVYLAQGQTLEREKHLRVWQAKRETYGGALAVLSEMRAAWGQRQSNGSVAQEMHRKIDSADRGIDTAECEDGRQKISQSKQFMQQRLERHIADTWADGKTFRSLREALPMWSARVKFDGTDAAALAFDAAVSHVQGDDQKFNEAHQRLVAEAKRDLDRFQ